nr:transcription initiation factor TFIID subunit 4-like [Kogia breviceps]
MVLSTRRGSRRAPPPRPRRPRGPGPGPAPRPCPAGTAPPAPPRRNPAAPLRHRHPRPPGSGWQRGGPGAGGGGRGPRLDTARGRDTGPAPRGQRTARGAGLPSRWLLRSAPSAMRAAARRRGPGARRGSAGLALGGGGGGSGASVQGSAGAAAPPPARPPSPPPRPRPRPPRRAPQRPPSRARARATRRPGQAWSRPGTGAAAVLSTSCARCWQRHGREPQAPLYSPRPIQDPGSGGGYSRHRPAPLRGAAPLPHCSPPSRRRPASNSPAVRESRVHRAAELGRVGKLRAGRGRGPTPPSAPPRHVLPLFPPRRRQLRAPGALSAASPPWPPEKPSTEVRTPSSLLPFNLLVPGEGS